MLVWTVIGNSKDPYEIPIAAHTCADLLHDSGASLDQDQTPETSSVQEADGPISGGHVGRQANIYETEIGRGSTQNMTALEELKKSDAFVDQVCASLDRLNLLPNEIALVSSVLKSTLPKNPEDRNLETALSYLKRDCEESW